MGHEKAGLRGQFTAANADIEEKRSQTNNLSLHLKEPEKEQTKSKVSRRKGMLRIRA